METKEFYLVKISYYRIMFGDELQKTDERLFSSIDKAKDFLVRNEFIYGCPFGFKRAGWYHCSYINRSCITDIVVATIEPIGLDDNSRYQIDKKIN